MKKVLIVFPTSWDRKQLSVCAADLAGRYELEYAEPGDDDCPWDFDVCAYIDEVVERYRGKIDGVLSSSDYPGATVAAAVATRLGLPGSVPEAVIRASHKYYSRRAQREAVPEATARFALVDPDSPAPDIGDVGFPCFIKPVKGAFSVMSRRLNSQEELEAFLDRNAVTEFRKYYLNMFNQLVRALTPFEFDGNYFLAEEFLHGDQVTLEGFEHDGAVEILGIVDSAKHPGTDSFAGFHYPSSLPASVQVRMDEVATQVVRRVGLTSSLFNIEMIYDAATDRIGIIELNPRLCGQFADLYKKVDGTSGYEVALAVATGERPKLQRNAGAFACAASLPLRIFEPARVVRAPGPADISAVEAAAPGTLVWSECETGQKLSDFESAEDGQSARYGITNLGGADRADLTARAERVRQRLSFEFEML